MNVSPLFFSLSSLRRQWLPAVLMAVAAMSGSTARAETGLTLELVSEAATIQPGQSFYAGVFIHHEPGYHTYWQYPGIVGVATSIEWQLPAGWKGGPLEYPAPQAIKMFQIGAQGFERDVLLQSRIEPPADLKPGTRVILRGKATWMCCGQSCFPGTKGLEAAVTVGERITLDPKWHSVFDEERSRFPRASPAWTATARETAETVTLTLAPASPQARPFGKAGDAARVRFFTNDGWINSDEPQKVRIGDDGTVILTLRRAEVFLGKERPARLYGVVEREGGWTTGEPLEAMIVSPALIP